MGGTGQTGTGMGGSSTQRPGGESGPSAEANVRGTDVTLAAAGRSSGGTIAIT